MAGAALLAGRAALLLGAGRVFVGFVGSAPPAVDPAQPELMLRAAKDLFAKNLLTVLAAGPGLGRSEAAKKALDAAIGAKLPLVLDADGLNLVAASARLAKKVAARGAPTIMTPHPAEAGRLLGRETHEVQSDRVAAAKAIAKRYSALVALKGNGTVIAAPGGSWWINPTGNPGMASAGMGDVLTGIIAALLAQGASPEDAAVAGVYLHGAAADRLVAAGAGPVGLTAGEVIDAARALLNPASAR
ncbi:MAG TPA: NAD(P)H-hydrate dehydratase, partial [Burkholderiales bacterium]